MSALRFIKERTMKLKLPEFIRRYLEYRYWRKRGYGKHEARKRARNTI